MKKLLALVSLSIFLIAPQITAMLPSPEEDATLSLKAMQQKHAANVKKFDRNSKICGLSGTCLLLSAMFVTYNHGFVQAAPLYAASTGCFMGTGAFKFINHAIRDMPELTQNSLPEPKQQ